MKKYKIVDRFIGHEVVFQTGSLILDKLSQKKMKQLFEMGHPGIEIKKTEKDEEGNRPE